MTRSRWTKKEDDILLKNIQFDDRGYIANISDLTFLLKNRKKDGIRRRVRNLREKGVLPDLDWNDLLYPRQRPFSKYEDKIIIGALKVGTTPTEIGAELDRSVDSIQGRIKRIREHGEEVPRLKRKFTDKEIEILIQNVKFDEYGYVSNTSELTSLLKRSKPVIRQKLMQLRRMGLIETLPDKSKSGISCNTRNAFRKQNDLCFVFNKKRPTPVSASVDKK